MSSSESETGAMRTIVLVRPFINIERNSPFFLPIGLLSVAAAVRAAGNVVKILDFEFDHRVGRGFAADEPISTFTDRILEHSASLVGITVLADTLPTALALGRALKCQRPETVVVLGGPGLHGTAHAIAARLGDCADYVCTAEGEAPLVALAESDLEQRNGVAGMLRTGKGGTAMSAARVHIDTLPFPAYDLVDVEKYLEIANPRIFDLHVGAGCTYKCSFCTTAPFWKHQFTARSPKSVFAEMERLKFAYGVTDFNLIHDNFANDRRYIEEFVSFFQEHNRHFTWGCAVRPDNVPLDLMKRMRAAGCRFLFCGTDAGDASILRDMRKMTSNVKSYRFFRDAREAGMMFETNTIIGYPNEDDEALEAAIKIVFDAIAHGGYTADVSILQPLPGTPVAAAYHEHIEPNLGALPTYMPGEALDLVAEHRDVFTGFGFIRHGNKSYEYYARLAELLRYFTRHYFRSIYFLKEVLKVPYRVSLESVATERVAARFGERLAGFAEELEISDSDHALFKSIFVFESGLEAAKGVDIEAEITNVYARPAQTADSERAIVVDVDHPVHQMFAGLPLVEPVECSPTSYLFRRSDGKIASVRLRSWQRELWQDLCDRPSPFAVDSTFLTDWKNRLATKTGVDFDAADAALASALRLFDANLTPEFVNG